jgi:large subunit ribosomal protein L33
MRGLDPRIHVLLRRTLSKKDVDGRDKPGHDVVAIFLDFWGLAGRVRPNSPKRFEMARATTIKVKLVSSADTGFYYVTKKNSRTMTEKLVMKKYDPVAKKHVEFREAKIK